MIKLFRNIRYDLMEKNKTGKYLIYAIGEILLLVIGILIALGINNWNAERVNKNKASILVERIKESLNQDLDVLTVKKIQVESKLQYLDTLWKDINSNEYVIIEINKKIDDFQMGIGSGIIKLNKVYNDLTNEGNIDLLSLDVIELINNIGKTYQRFEFANEKQLVRPQEILTLSAQFTLPSRLGIHYNKILNFEDKDLIKKSIITKLNRIEFYHNWLNYQSTSLPDLELKIKSTLSKLEKRKR